MKFALRFLASSQTFAPLRIPIFRNVWFANLISSFGTLIHTVAAAWLMTTLTSSADMVAFVQTAAALPVMMFSVVAGAIADNYDRRTVMLTAQILLFAASLLLTFLIFINAMTPWILLVFMFLIGFGMALHNPSWFASVGDMVSKTDLPAAVSLNALGNNIARGAGPAVGGLIIAVSGLTIAFAVNALSYVFLIFALWQWKPAKITSTLPKERISAAVFTGFQYVWLSPPIRRLIARAFLFGFSAVAILALLPTLTSRSETGNALWYGILFGFFGIGAVAAGLISNYTRSRLSVEWIVRLSFIIFAFCSIVLPFVINSGSAVFVLFLAGGSWTAALSLIHIAVQLSSARWVIGRAISIFHMANFGGMAIGSWVWGMAADTYGLKAALAIAAGFLLFGAFSGIGRFALPNLSPNNLDPMDHWQDPRTTLNLHARSGPVTITVEYAIDDASVHEFLKIMKERRRIRRRDGARRWSIAHDATKPSYWIETYQLPTWGDYIRHSRRATQADADIMIQLRQLQTTQKHPIHRCFIQHLTGSVAVYDPPRS